MGLTPQNSAPAEWGQIPFAGAISARKSRNRGWNGHREE